MHGSLAGSRLALIRKRLRGYFGITAPQVSVRVRMPPLLRLVATVVVLGTSLALAAWIYDAGRRFAGFDRGESQTEIGELRDKVSALTAEVARLRGIADSGDSNLQIERTSVEQLTRQVKTLEDENAKLKESLAVFENLANGGTRREAATLTRLRVEPDGQRGRYHFHVLASRQGVQANQEFRGSLQVYVTVRQPAGDSVMMIFPRSEDPAAQQYPAEFRNFRNLDGYFQVPADSRVLRVEVRLVQDGAVKASQSISL
jgi:cell division protein FtsB